MTRGEIHSPDDSGTAISVADRVRLRAGREAETDVVTEVQITLPGVSREDPRLDALMDLAMESSDETLFSSTTRAPVDAEVQPVEPHRPGMVRRAVVHIWPDELRSLIDLPEGMTVAGVHATWDPHGIAVVIEGGSLTEVAEDARIPGFIGGAWSRRILTGPDGLRYARFGWEPDVPADAGVAE